MSDWGWKPVAGQSGSYEGTGTLAGRATITKESGARGGTKGFVLTLDGTKHSMGKKASFDHADKLVQDNQYGYVPPAADAGGGAVQSGPRGGKYIEGPGGSKQYVKSIEGAPMNPYNNSVKPLNWSPPKIEEHVEKSIGASSDSFVRAGTPPTRRGSFNGHVSALQPPVQGAHLYLETPASVAKSQTPVVDTGPARRAALDQAFAKAMGLPQVPLRPEQPQGAPGMAPPPGPPGSTPGVPAQGGGAAGPPGMGMAPPAPQGQGQAMQQPMAMTPDGMPIMADPFAPQHAQFQAPEHQMAQLQHEQAGAGAPPPEAAQHAQAAQAHGQMGEDAKSPMERSAGKFPAPAGGPEASGEMPPMNQGPPPAPPQAAGPPPVNPPMSGAGGPPPGPPGAEAGGPPPGAEAGPPPGPPGAGAPPPVNPPMPGMGGPPPQAAPPGMGGPPPQAAPPGMGGPPPAPQAGPPPVNPPMPGGPEGPQLAAPKPPPMPPMAPPGQPPMGTPQGEAPMGQQGAAGGPMDQGKPQAPPQPEGMDRQGPKPGMSERPPGAGAESEMGAGMGGATGQGGAEFEQLMQFPEIAQNPQAMSLLQQIMSGMEAPKAPTPGSSSEQGPKGKPEKQTGANSPFSHAGNQTTDIEPNAEKSLGAVLGWS